MVHQLCYDFNISMCVCVWNFTTFRLDLDLNYVFFLYNRVNIFVFFSNFKCLKRFPCSRKRIVLIIRFVLFRFLFVFWVS